MIILICSASLYLSDSSYSGLIPEVYLYHNQKVDRTTSCETAHSTDVLVFTLKITVRFNSMHKLHRCTCINV